MSVRKTDVFLIVVTFLLHCNFGGFCLQKAENQLTLQV